MKITIVRGEQSLTIISRAADFSELGGVIQGAAFAALMRDDVAPYGSGPHVVVEMLADGRCRVETRA